MASLSAKGDWKVVDINRVTSRGSSMESAVVLDVVPAKKCRTEINEDATPLDLAFRDAYDFIRGKNGRIHRSDFDFAMAIGPARATDKFRAVRQEVAETRKGKLGSEKTLRQIESKVWPERLPSGKMGTFYKFYLGKKGMFSWAALSLIELPATISMHRGKFGHLYLAVEYLDIFEGFHSPNSLVGHVNQWSLFVAHAFDRYAKRILKQHVTRSEALKLFSEASLTAESKALIEDDKGVATYVIKTKETCIYFFGYSKICDHEIYRFFKTIIDESMLRDWQRKYLTALHATSDTWSDRASSWRGWKKIPIVRR